MAYMTTTAADRVKIMMRDLGNLDQPAFGKLAGASKAMVNHWLTGQVKTITAQYAFTLQKNTGFNAEWIQTGEGPERLEKRNYVGEQSLAESLYARYISAPEEVQKVIDTALALSSTSNADDPVHAAVKAATVVAKSTLRPNQGRKTAA